ncbi:integrase [Burkholderia sp. ABCPW 11]|uniref:site-specific integrase n=1 Tax=Burkholderia sp. ABCPW 11 TaxID=1637859 RepID=UPI00075D030B|nr:site-specific integrase [Burkholderia sp. ABCPW 11]KVD48630.1 integrase [Burkholderia sp. ABCPW 11]
MPKVAKELGALAVSRLKEPGSYPVGKVAGLYLQVASPTARSWILRVKIGDRRREIGLGPYPAVSLQDARTKAQVERDKIRAGVDPVLERKAAESALRAAHASEITFAEAARQFIASRAHGWKNAKHGDQWRNTIAEYADPILGKMLVRHITREHVLRVLDPIWTTKTETASRLRGRIENVLDWARVKGYRDGENPALWRGNLDHLLAKPSAIAKVRHHPALPYQDMGAFMERLRAIDAMGARCLEFTILTAARSGEARGARWSEFDLDAGVWRVPPDRMKQKKEHRVPLSAAVVAMGAFMERLRAIDAMGARCLEFTILTAARSGEARGARWSEFDLDAGVWRVPPDRMKQKKEHRVPLSAAVVAFLKALPRNDPDDPDALVFPSPRGKVFSDMTLLMMVRRLEVPATPHGFRSTFRDWAGECTSHPRELIEVALAHIPGDQSEMSYWRGDVLERRRQLMADWAVFISRPFKKGTVLPLQRQA